MSSSPASATRATAPTDGALPPRIGRFTPDRVLGRGGQGVVYLARDPDLDRDVAIKVLARGAHDASRLVTEARHVARLDHPGITALFEINLDHEPPYLVSQVAGGVKLRELYTRGAPLAVNRALRLMARTLDAVHYAHQHDVLHRDLTPDNILVDADDNPRILDFGIAVALSQAGSAGDMSGTVNYMAPEVLAEKPPLPASDIFSLGAVLHEMLTGQQLFRADNRLAVAYKILNERVLPPSMTRDGIDPELDQLVMRALDKEPGRRFASAADMRAAIDEYLRPGDDRPADKPAAEGRGAAGAVEFLCRRMARRPDFPAVSRHISEINQKSGSDADANELSAIILKDYALTAKLLKVVNSAVYGQYGGSISTVSRAVVILGFEQVRAIALGIIIFEHLKNGDQAALLKDAATSSFLSGMLARELGQGDASRQHEEAFIAAMLHRLGRHLAIYYFPDEIGDVNDLMVNKQMSESAAAREIFGADFYEFGVAIARQWNLPERLIGAMREPPSGKVDAPMTADKKLALVSAFSNEVAETLGGGDDPDAALEALLERYDDGIPIEPEALKEAVQQAVDATREYAGIISVDVESTPLLKRIEGAVRPPTESTAGDKPAPADDAGPGEVTLGGVDGDPEPHPDPAAGGTADAFLTDAIAELTGAIVENAPLNDMFMMVLEAFYRGMGFAHVLLLLRDQRNQHYATRFGFGTGIEQLKSEFIYRPGSKPDIFQLAADRARNAIILDTSEPRYRQVIPSWVFEQTDPRSLLLFPIVVQKKCIAMIYADTVGEVARVDAAQLKLLNTLVKQLVLGMQPR